MRVLVVDDESAFAGPLAQRLSLRGMDARTARDAREALSILQAWPAELVFLDVGLPGMDGVALLKLLREQYAQTDVVMLSGSADMGKAVQAMRRGALNWLSKPADIEQVLEECRKARERAAARQEAARLAEAARWRSLGRVAEGVAHEVNNPLNIMMQAAGLIRDCLDEPEAQALADVDEMREAVNTIRAQSLRVREITRKLLMVGHGLDARTGPLDVAAVIDESLDLLRHRIEAAGLRCQVDLSGAYVFPGHEAAAQETAAPGALGEAAAEAAEEAGSAAPRPWGSAPELRQIFLHLFENALDAMPHGGLVQVSARLRRDGQGRSWYDLLVADSGPGIEPDILPHIFEPFFSSRALQGGFGCHDQYHDSHTSGSAMRPGTAVQSHMGRYAGLGLAVARSLAHARGGELSAANSQQGGAVFCLSLPLAQAPAASGQAAGDRSLDGGL
ncbi:MULTISPECIES: hybrid sensor histidine kinase/response regulator [Desulfovibrio]|uniref:histidine kinase n=1 Tax=Desulfovibrio desulfuricans TaxID=876 RepID=A0AA94HQU3_DESDE|nr:MULTISPECIES: hybrid sensor histidine kinase/response regulator [Desulfovibrio]ATD81698.1 hybrid sensor histidine kinase/response regulator [Desulfovibrio sp. G11]SFW17504.1 His Kinase A (phospho-acceptor) domain-containing protein [Desulfovibrio desulfuricans]SPD34422.1 histidine kinase, two-component system [Desulfovibrio sp. G11]